jgi:IS1 family transposase
LVGVEHKTVMRVLARAGEASRRLLDSKIRNVKARRVEVDEIWSFVFKKQTRLTEKDDETTMGDQYVFTGMDAETKLMISYLVGKRDAATAFKLIRDLKDRLAHRVQLTTDGFRPYLSAIEDNFGADIDYAMLVKVYGKPKIDEEGPEWYGPARVIAAAPMTIMGEPKFGWISTSYIERSNLSMRMGMRRFTRLTNGFSKKLANLKSAVALYFAHYNFVRIHQSLRVTPAMQAGITNHVWEMEELLTCEN